MSGNQVPADDAAAGPPLRIGILGVARISGEAVVLPAQALGHRLVSIASRDPARARFFADLCRVERVARSYEALLADPEVDVVYIPLPPVLHARWTRAAIAAGKHVLCEKPLTIDAAEARVVRATATAAGVHVHEAYHHLCHPLYETISGLLNAGELGAIERVEAQATMRPPAQGDPRWSAELGGGALLDLGCYVLQVQHWLGRWADGAPRVVDASAVLRGGVDTESTAQLRFPSGAEGVMHVSIVAERPSPHSLRIECERGTISVEGFVLPHLGGMLTVTYADGRERVTEFDAVTTYQHQLRRFAALVHAGQLMPTDLTDAVATMALLDDVRRLSR